MKQMIFDYVCDLADDPDSPVTDDDAWEIHDFVFSQFDCADIYDQIDELIHMYFANK
tara:strand:- start:538 stop:708 length:171 start_codon:yes stop_codon:yes gene_type:complete